MVSSSARSGSTSVSPNPSFPSTSQKRTTLPELKGWGGGKEYFRSPSPLTTQTRHKPGRPQILDASVETAERRESAPSFNSSDCLTMPIALRSSSEISLSGPDASSPVTFE